MFWDRAGLLCKVSVSLGLFRPPVIFLHPWGDQPKEAVVSFETPAAAWEAPSGAADLREWVGLGLERELYYLRGALHESNISKPSWAFFKMHLQFGQASPAFTKIQFGPGITSIPEHFWWWPPVSAFYGCLVISSPSCTWTKALIVKLPGACLWERGDLTQCSAQRGELQKCLSAPVLSIESLQCVAGDLTPARYSLINTTSVIRGLRNSSQCPSKIQPHQHY